MILIVKWNYFFIMVNCVFFEVQTEFLNNIHTCFGFKGLISSQKRRRGKATFSLVLNKHHTMMMCGGVEA
jgi:hypothetical protein